MWLILSSSSPLSPSLNLFQCLLGSEAESCRVVTRARGLCDIWPLTGCVADPGEYGSTMGGTCPGLVTMVTQDLWGNGRGVKPHPLSWSVLTICCQLTLIAITHTRHRRVCMRVQERKIWGWLSNLCRQLWWCFIFSQSPGEILQFV